MSHNDFVEIDRRFDELIEKLEKANPKVDTALVRRAFAICKNAHLNQQRKSGEPYVVHPLEVAHVLADMELDATAIISGLLHDCIEDTEVTYSFIESEFGKDVADVVEGVTKLEKLSFSSLEDQQVENVRKMLLAMAQDVRVILIKLADRLHNMRTLKYMPVEKQLIKAKETLDVYAPLAHRLGISKIKWELEDLSLRFLDPVAYYEIVDGINQKKEERDECIAEFMETLEKRLEQMGIPFKMYGRAKHFYSIFRKMYKQNKSLDEIYDLFAVRIIVDSVNDCYAALGMVHEMYTPIPGRIKDYIAMPKPNMYQSLHTTVMGPTGNPFEIQIRTWEMHEIAEKGVAAHWKYKEGKSAPGEMDEKLQWVRQLLEIQSDADNPDDFMGTLKIDLFADEVFVFTPKGDVISLPAGATAIDFAFYIHSAVGYRMVGAKVNSKIVPLDYHLKNGDIVEVLTSSAVHGPSKDWLKIVKTSQAKNKINQWFKRENRAENIEKGKELIEKELHRMGYKHETLFQPDAVEQMLRRMNFNSLDDMYSTVGYGAIQAVKILNRLKDYNKEILKEQEEKQNQKLLEMKAKPHKRSGEHGIHVSGIDNCLIRISRCCTPLPGDDIVGFITRGRGVSVHRKDCANVIAMLSSEEEKSRMIECSWEDNTGGYVCEIVIEGTDRNGFLMDVASVLADMKISVHALNARVKKKSHLAAMEATLEIRDIEQLEAVIKRLRQIYGVTDVTRYRN